LAPEFPGSSQGGEEGHGAVEVHVRGGEDADVGAAGDGLTDALICLLLQEPEQLRLRIEREIADLVEQERASPRASSRRRSSSSWARALR